MSDPLPNATAPDPMSEADRQARIEHLLLSGLDQYFAGRYERAINIWTRVSFLERGHGRARAYIERARGALAERQREADELIHAGVEAYHAGELQAARDLLTRATDAGVSSDTAMLFIDRIKQLDATADLRVPPSPAAAPMPPPTPGGTPVRASWPRTIAVSALVAASILLGSMRIASWLSELPIDAPVAAGGVGRLDDAPRQRPADPLPIVRASEMRIARAGALFKAGRPAAALRSLDEIDIGDPRRGEADHLRADIQRALLGTEQP